jgi:hypothetical protein
LEKARSLVKRLIGKPFVSKHLLFIPSDFKPDITCEEPRYSFVNRLRYRTSLSEILRFEILNKSEIKFSYDLDYSDLWINIKLSDESKQVLLQDKLGSEDMAIYRPNFKSEFQTELENGLQFLYSNNRELNKSVINLVTHHKSHSVRYTLNGNWIIIEFYNPQLELLETPNRGSNSIDIKH